MLDAMIFEGHLKKHLSLSYNITHVTSLGAAISEANNENAEYDLVFLDLNLEDSRWMHTLKTFTSMCHHIPIMVVSAICDSKVINQAILSGAASYIIKGQDKPQTVIDEINHILSNSGIRNFRRTA